MLHNPENKMPGGSKHHSTDTIECDGAVNVLYCINQD